MKLTLLASLLLLSLVFGQCPTNFAIPNLVSGTPHITQILYSSQSFNLQPIKPKHIGILLLMSYPQLHQLHSVLTILFSSSRIHDVLFHSSCVLHCSHINIIIGHRLHFCIHYSMLDQGEIQFLGFYQQ